MARFIDLFVVGDGEEALPAICDAWLELRAGGRDRLACLVELARRFTVAYVPRCYEVLYDDRGRPRRPRPIYSGVPELIQPAVVRDLDGLELPSSPIVPNVECVHDRIAIEIMRGCPWRCRFCQSSPIKRPLRYRRVETIVEAARESYRTTGNNEISLLSLSTSDYPHFEELMRRMQETFRPLGVSVSVPSLRVNEQLLIVTELMNTDRHSGLTFAPEVALDDMRRQIGKPIRNEALYAGSQKAFEAGFNRVKLYFMCGLPGERPADLDGILENGRRDLEDRPRRGAVGEGGGQRLELRPQAAHSLPVERDADAGVSAASAPAFASAARVARGGGEVSRHRDQPPGGRHGPG